MQLLKMQTKQQNLTPLQKKNYSPLHTYCQWSTALSSCEMLQDRIVATQQFAPHRMPQVWEEKIKVNT